MSEEQILVVDDDPKIARLVRGYLEQAGFRVTVAHDGNEALHALRIMRPALVVLDIMLPGQDGLAITRYVRSDPALEETAILLLTARVEDVDRITGLELGADDYVTKPFNPREVVARVKAILRRTTQNSGTPAPQLLQVGQLMMDVTTHRTTLHDTTVGLTPSEFDILRLLMEHPRQTFSRSQIIEQGLGYDYDGLERTVDSHIKNLRRKLEIDPRRPLLIETVFGVGYRLNPP